jgi:hypothetical protein
MILPRNVSGFASCASFIDQIACANWCRWNGTDCVDLVCYSESQAAEGFEWNHARVCGDRPFRPSAYPTRSVVGSWDEFPDEGSHTMQYNSSYVPFSVDVDLLEDAEIASLCLTTAQCRFPPMLALVRDAATGLPWRPRFGDFDASEGTNVPDSPKTTGPLQYNYRTRTYANMLSNTYFPRGSDASNATIVRVDFVVRRRKLYLYVDLTCGLADGYERRNGFTGNWGGQFKEVLFKVPGLNIHNPMRADTVGYTTNPSHYGDPVGTRSLRQTFVFQGSGNVKTKTYAWVALHQSWLTVSPVYPPEAIPAYLDAGLKWAALLLPAGNAPVASMYVHAANLLLKRTRGFVSFAAIRAYGGHTYDQYRAAVEYLLRLPNLDSATACRNSLPRAFLALDPPERGCTTVLDCTTWRHPDCTAFSDMMRQALNTIFPQILPSIPRCVDCPGLIGVSRGGVPPENPLYDQIRKFPQCLPHKLPNGTLLVSASSMYF